MDAKHRSNGISEMAMQTDAFPKAWSKSQADEWRKDNRSLSLFGVWLVQAAVALLMVLVVHVWLANTGISWSVGYGAICVLLPSAMFLHGVAPRKTSVSASGSMAKLVLWEMLKIVLTIFMLFLAPKVVAEVNWPALLAGFVVTIKAYWLALWLQALRKKLPVVSQ